jgi:transcriptional regulator with XRE-family HTH domain
MSIFSRIEVRQKELGLSNGALCRAANIDYRTYSDLRRGSTPKWRTLSCLAAVLGLSPLWLETGRGPKEAADYERMLTEWEATHTNESRECANQ